MTPAGGLEGSGPGGDQPAPVLVEFPITLGQFVKVAGLAVTGGEAKHLVTSGLVSVNGRVHIHRGRKLQPGDLVECQGVINVVVARFPSERPAVLQD